MKTAIRTDTKNEVTADEADARGITGFICPMCKRDVRLHRGKKIAHHFEHLQTGRPPCPNSYAGWIAKGRPARHSKKAKQERD